MPSSDAVKFEQEQAKIDVQEVINQEGQDIKMYIRGESEQIEDKYGSVKQACENPPLEIKAHPVTYNPNEDKIKACGLKEEVTVIIHTAMKDYEDNNYTYDDIEKDKCNVTLDGKTYAVKDKNRFGQVGDDFLYIVLGLFK